MQNKKRYILAFLLSFITAIATASDGNPELVKVIAERLNKQIAQNAWNEHNGKSGENNYIIDLSDVKDFLNKETHIKPVGKPFVTETENVNERLVELAEQNAISLYVLLNGHLLDFRYSSEGKKVTATKESHINTQEIIEASIKAAYNQSDLTKDETGRHALLGITPLTLYYIGKTEDKDLVPTHAFQRAVYPGKAFSRLKEQMKGKVSSFKYAGQDHNEVFEKHVDAYIQGLKDYKGDEPQSGTTDEFTLADASKFTIVNQKPLAAYAEDTKEKKEANYITDVKGFAASFKQLKGANEFVSISEKFNAINPLNSLYIEDKIKAFNQETDGKYSIYVIIKEVEYYLDKVDWKKFSDDVNKEAGASQNDLIIAIPYTIYEDASIRYNTGALGVKDVFFPFPGNSGYGENGNGKALTDLLEYFNEVYSGLAKPYAIIDYLVNFDGTIVRHEVNSQSYITGKSNVLYVRVHYDQILDLYNTLLQQSEGDISIIDFIYNGYSNYAELGKYKELDVNALKMKESQIRFYEKQIVSKSLRNKLQYFHDYKEYEFGSISIPYEATWNEPPDPVIILIDVLSIITSPVGGDVAFDALGSIYSYHAGRKIDAAMYGASVAPFVSGGGAKLAKESLSNILNLISKSSKTQIKQSLFERVFKTKGDDLIKLMAKSSSDDILSNPKLISKIEVIDPQSSPRLLKDMLENDELMSRMVADENLLDPWVQLDKAGLNDRLRRNPDVLERTKSFTCN